jgi:hypothetical protein
MEDRTSPPSPTNKYLNGGRYLNSSVIFQITPNAQRIKRVEAELTQNAFTATPLLALSFVGFMFSEVFKGFCLVFNFCRG